MKRISSCIVFLFLISTSCVYHDLADLTNCSASTLQLEVDTVISVSDCLVQDGVIRVNASGGIEPYTFLLNETFQPEGNFEGIKAGTYSVLVRDKNGCEAHIDNITVPAEGLSFNVSVQENNVCIGGNGSITIDVIQGYAPFQYKRADGEFTDNNKFTALSPGNHALAIKDSLNCIYQLNITVPTGTTGVSWSNTIKPIMQTSCALSRCHNGISRPDLRIYQNAKFYAASIKNLTLTRSMPLEGTLTQEQISLIACWVNDGSPEN